MLALPGVTMAVVRGLLSVARMLAAAALRTRTRDEVLAAALHLGVPMAPVNTPEDFVAAEQTRTRGYFQETRFPHFGEAPLAQPPWRLSVTPARLRRPPPGAGEDDSRGFAARPELGAATCERALDSDETTSPVLSGTRVINLGVGAVGPELCSLLGDLGAEVIKIESRANLDFMRRLTPGARQPEHLVPVQRQLPRPEERLPRPAYRRARERSRSNCARAPTSWWRTTGAAWCGAGVSTTRTSVACVPP